MRFDNLHINEHTSETCERVTTHQIEELKAALYGGSDEYELTDICKYLEVTPNTWFGEWMKCQMQEYISKFNEFTAKDVKQQKAICIDSNQLEREDNVQEFKEIPNIVEEKLEEKREYLPELRKGISEEVHR